MIIVEEFTTPLITMYLRDFTIESFEVEIISENDRSSIYETITGTYDSFKKTLSFSYDTSVLYPENFYILKIWETGKVKLLSQDKMYVLPVGETIKTYQPKLITTDKTMDNEFKIYGE